MNEELQIRTTRGRIVELGLAAGLALAGALMNDHATIGVQEEKIQSLKDDIEYLRTEMRSQRIEIDLILNREKK